MLKVKMKLDSSAFTPEEKSQMIALLVQKGCTQSTAYVRLFRDGFNEWQLVGIRRLLREYCDSRGLEYPDELTRHFYRSLPSRTDFKDYMQSKGMCRGTAKQRFSSINFKEWELEGINQIFEGLCQDQKEFR